MLLGRPQMGAGGRVRLEECFAACLMATGCTDVSFNAVLGLCFLKHGSSRLTCLVRSVDPQLYVSTSSEPLDDVSDGELQLCGQPDWHGAGVRLRVVAVVVPGAQAGPGGAQTRVVAVTTPLFYIIMRWQQGLKLSKGHQ